MIDLNKTFETEDQFQVSAMMMISQEFPQLRGKVWHTENEGYIPINQIAKVIFNFLKIPMVESVIKKMDFSSITQQMGSKSKAKGMMSGIPDILILNKGILYPIELKLPGGKLVDSQKSLHNVWNNDSIIIVKVCFNLREVYDYCCWVVSSKYFIDVNI